MPIYSCPDGIYCENCLPKWEAISLLAFLNGPTSSYKGPRNMHLSYSGSNENKFKTWHEWKLCFLFIRIFEWARIFMRMLFIIWCVKNAINLVIILYDYCYFDYVFNKCGEVSYIFLFSGDSFNLSYVYFSTYFNIYTEANL